MRREHTVALGKPQNPATWTIHDTDSGPVRINSQTGEAQAVTVNGEPIAGKQKLTQSQPIMGPDGKPHTYMLDEHGQTVRDLGVHYERPMSVNVAASREPRQMVYVPDGNGGMRATEVTPGTVVPIGASRTPGGPKIDAEEQKRADLAENLNENIGTMEDILQRRPELFGMLRGRMTQLSNAVGTDDNDIATLMTIEHQLGMVAQGAHGMRSAQGVVAAAQSLTNGFHNSPTATKAALESARHSVKTFLNDSQSAGQPRTAPSVTTAPTAAQRTPGSHQFSISAWRNANPRGDASAAQAAATSQGYTVVN